MQLRKMLIAAPDKAFIHGTQDQLDALTVAVQMHLGTLGLDCVYARTDNCVELRDFFYAGEVDAANKVLRLAYNMGLTVNVESHLWGTDQKSPA